MTAKTEQHNHNNLLKSLSSVLERLSIYVYV